MSGGKNVTLLVYPSCPSWAKTIFHAVSTRVGSSRAEKAHLSPSKGTEEKCRKGGTKQKNNRLERLDEKI